MDYVVIMAAGTGKRLWPLSRKKRPKQVLKLLDGQTLLRKCFQRLSPVFDVRNIIVLTNAGYADLVRENLPELPYGYGRAVRGGGIYGSVHTAAVREASIQQRMEPVHFLPHETGYPPDDPGGLLRGHEHIGIAHPVLSSITANTGCAIPMCSR